MSSPSPSPVQAAESYLTKRARRGGARKVPLYTFRYLPGRSIEPASGQEPFVDFIVRLPPPPPDPSLSLSPEEAAEAAEVSKRMRNTLDSLKAASQKHEANKKVRGRRGRGRGRGAGYLAKKKGKEFPDIRVPEEQGKPIPHIPTGVDILDFLIGGSPNKFGVCPCPGLPRGRVTHLWQTSDPTLPSELDIDDDTRDLAMGECIIAEAIANALHSGLSVAYVDNSLGRGDLIAARTTELLRQGFSLPYIQVPRAPHVQNATSLVATLGAAGVDLVVLDTLGRDSTDNFTRRPGEVQSIWSQELPNLKRVFGKTGSVLFAFSEAPTWYTRDGPPTPSYAGGNSWKFYSSVRLEVQDTDQGAAVRAVRCKVSRNQGREEMLEFTEGGRIDNVTWREERRRNLEGCEGDVPS